MMAYEILLLYQFYLLRSPNYELLLMKVEIEEEAAAIRKGH